MPWLELRISTSRNQAPALEDALLEAGALSITLQDNADEPIFEPGLGETPLWTETRVTGLFEADVDSTQVESALALPNATFRQWHIVEDKDWEREWMQHYHPIQCADKLWICPSWMDSPDPNAVNILLDPGLAFGTGTHPTTFQCLQWMGSQDFAGKSVIDYGCGSGILAIAALLLGAGDVSGVDIDPQALIATRENAQRNGFNKDRVPVFFPKTNQLEPAQYLLANILSGPLVELAPTLSQLVLPHGLLCLSGILDSQVELVKTAYAEQFKFIGEYSKEGWACLVAQKLA